MEGDGSDEVKIAEVVMVGGDGGEEKKEEEEKGATQDAKLSKLERMLEEEAAKTRKMMKMVSGMCIVGGGLTFLVTSLICCTSYRVRPEMAAFSYIVSILALAAAVGINKIYGFQSVTFPKVGSNVRVVAPLSVFRIRGSSEVALIKPRTFLVISSLVLLCCSLVMVTGDVRLANHYWTIPEYMKGSNLVHAAFSSVFIVCSLLNLVLAFVNADKSNKTLISTSVIFNVIGFALAIALVIVNWNAVWRNRMRRLDTERLDMIARGEDAASEVGYPFLPFTTWIVMKFFPADILVVFCAANVLCALGLVVAVNQEDTLHEKRERSVPLGVVGLVAIVAGIALEIMLTSLPYLVQMRYYNLDLLLTMKVSAVSLLLLVGIQGFFSFYSAKTFRRFTLFFLALGLAGVCGFALVVLTQFDGNARQTEGKSLATCQGVEHDGNKFCVYNTTSNYLNNFARRNREWNGNQKVETAPPVVCIPREKYCDGKVDLVSPATRDE